MSEELQAKRKPGRPRKDELRKFEIPTETEAHTCPVCDGSGYIEIEDEDENGNISVRRDPCDYCDGTGKRPVGLFSPDDVSDEDIAAIEKSIGYTSKAWGFIDERTLIAAAANRMGSKPIPA